MVKRLHFEKHRESATYHPILCAFLSRMLLKGLRYALDSGWQAGPQTPILRLLVLLDGEASDSGFSFIKDF